MVEDILLFEAAEDTSSVEGGSLLISPSGRGAPDLCLGSLPFLRVEDSPNKSLSLFSSMEYSWSKVRKNSSNKNVEDSPINGSSFLSLASWSCVEHSSSELPNNSSNKSPLPSVEDGSVEVSSFSSVVKLLFSSSIVFWMEWKTRRGLGRFCCL
jgi:hypothetical protein